MEDLFKEDFITTMVDNDYYSQKQAEQIWSDYGEAYTERIWEHMGEEMYQIQQQVKRNDLDL